jgi:hypothetical protein
MLITHIINKAGRATKEQSVKATREQLMAKSHRVTRPMAGSPSRVRASFWPVMASTVLTREGAAVYGPPRRRKELEKV